MGKFEYNPSGSGMITGSLDVSVLDPNGVAPRNIIRVTDPWQLHVDWHITGEIVGMLAGKWHLTAYLERMGPGSDLTLPTPPPFEAEITSGTPSGLPLDRYDYHHLFSFAPGSVAVGAYKLVVVLTSQTALGAPGPFAAYDQMRSLIQFYP